MAYDQVFLACDTETGGLPSTKNGTVAFDDVALTEIAIVAIDNVSLKVIDKAGWLIKPYKEDLEYNPFAAKVSGITKQMCEDEGEDVKEVHKQIKKFIRKHCKGTEKGYFVGQKFIEFDIPFMENFFKHCKDDFWKYCEKDVKDTMFRSREIWPNENKHNLNIICERLGISYVEAHRALPDTEMTAKVWIEMIKLQRGVNGTKKEDGEKEEAKRVNFEIDK